VHDKTQLRNTRTSHRWTGTQTTVYSFSTHPAMMLSATVVQCTTKRRIPILRCTGTGDVHALTVWHKWCTGTVIGLWMILYYLYLFVLVLVDAGLMKCLTVCSCPAWWSYFSFYFDWNSQIVI